ncbi:MAG: CmpA/NrtA family ABC transporter substrate-binding protein [Candidatus Thiodiazotropha endolucinida]
MSDNLSLNPDTLEKNELILGFIPLTDCAPLVIAKEMGFFEKYGLEVSLSKETSWANIRDKVAIGILDGAQMLAPMPLAMSLGLGPIQKPMVTAFSMDLNGNAITVSSDLYREMLTVDSDDMLQHSTTVLALKTVIDNRNKKGLEPLSFAVVFPFSTHNYELRYWMASAGIDPDRDVRLVVVPPSQMVEQLQKGLIDGYCVGEPWNSIAVQKGLGHTLITKYEIWKNSPEKVFGVTEEWAVQHPNTHLALLRALLEASRWVDSRENRAKVTEIISRSIYINAPENIVRMSMTGTYQFAPNSMPQALPDFNVFHRYAANYPWRSHAVWFMTQMIRWGQIEEPIDIHATAAEVYRPDIYRAAGKLLGIAAPTADHKLEGAHHQNWKLVESSVTTLLGADSFFDDSIFDPMSPLDYLKSFPIHNMSLALQQLQDSIRYQSFQPAAVPVDQEIPR